MATQNSRCRCPAYTFPHRTGGGKCERKLGPVCSHCGHACTAFEVDGGIGNYEFWGVKDYDDRKIRVSDCCEAEVIE